MPRLQHRKNNKLTRLLWHNLNRKTSHYFNLGYPTANRSKERMLHPNHTRYSSTQNFEVPTLLFTGAKFMLNLSKTAAHGRHAIRRHWGHPQSTHWRGRSKASSHTSWASHSRHWWCRQSKRQQLSIHVLQQKAHLIHISTTLMFNLLRMLRMKDAKEEDLSTTNISEHSNCWQHNIK